MPPNCKLFIFYEMLDFDITFFPKMPKFRNGCGGAAEPGVAKQFDSLYHAVGPLKIVLQINQDSLYEVSGASEKLV